MKKYTLCLMVAVLAACAGNTPKELPPEDISSLKGSGTLTIKHYVPMPFTMLTPKGAVESGVGKGLGSSVVESMTDGKEKTDGSGGHVRFDASTLGHQLANLLSDKLLESGVNVLKVDAEPLPRPIKKDQVFSDNSDYVFVTAIINNAASYFPLNWKRYGINLFVTSRLIRQKDQAELWKYTCVVQGIKDERVQFSIEEAEQRIPDAENTAVEICTNDISEKLTKSL